MIDLMAIGSSSLRAYRASLEVVSGNVANASTEGYARRRADLAAGPVLGGDSLRYLGIAGGSGVHIGGVSRSYDMFLAQEARQSRSVAARDDAGAVWLAEIERALGAQENGVGKALNRFLNAGDELAASPTSIAARTLFASEASNVAGMFKEAGSALSGLKADITTEASEAATQVTAALRAIASVNARLERAGEGSAATASLLDERDRQLQAISEFVPIHVTRLGSGRVDVRLEDANGEYLVKGDKVAALAIDASGTSPVLLVDADFAPRQIAAPTAGKIAGLIDAHGKAASALGDLDALANRFADQMNEAHMAGSDLNGDRGGPLFRNLSLTLAAGPGNSGRAVIKTDPGPGPLFAGGYLLVHDGTTGDWTLSRSDNSSSVSGQGVLTLDEMAVELGGQPAGGDRYTLNPATGASSLSALIEYPQKIAAAAAFQIENASPALSGSRVSLDPTAALPAASLYHYSWIDAATVEVTDASGTVLATVPYAAGDTLEGSGFRLSVPGTPAAGDSIDVYPTPAGHSDNRNIVSLVALGGAGGEAFENRFAAQRSHVSTDLSQIRRRAEISTIAADGAARAQSNASGVNLDEEAADLIRFQQAYEASTRIIAAARDMFDSLLRLG